ncbi:MAG TPA: type II toxin-antitoxin system VapC family toxin [Polyangiaceae bacterium]|jgi:predicted nucleic acid-binding protein|nr:type II toxin-antitoxin system VapC family toxin [Polyangiaceae bacterium]
MAEIVLDANVIVALLYESDSHHQRAKELAERLEREGHDLVLVDFLVFEALSVLCRRAAQRKTAPPDLNTALATMRHWFDNGEVRFLAHEGERLATSVLDIVADSEGLLNANDALLVALQYEAAIDTLATFDRQFDLVAKFEHTS